MATLQSNVEVNGEWFGPSYPAAGDPPDSANINPAAYEPADVYDQRLGFREDDFAARGEPTGILDREPLKEAAFGDQHPRAARQSPEAEQEPEATTEAEHVAEPFPAAEPPHRAPRRTGK